MIYDFDGLLLAVCSSSRLEALDLGAQFQRLGDINQVGADHQVHQAQPDTLEDDVAIL